MPSHIVPLVGQKLTWGCWAAGLAMMDSWRSGKAASIDSTLQRFGPVYVAAYAANKGLNTAQLPAALTAMGLKIEPPANPTASKWLQLIGDSPLFVVVDENPHPGKFAVHARVVFDIKTDAANTVSFNDPADNSLTGGIKSQPLSDFVRDYEQLACSNLAGLQIINF